MFERSQALSRSTGAYFAPHLHAVILLSQTEKNKLEKLQIQDE